MPNVPDFSGWATKTNILCSDGRTIMPGAFDENDGKKVPLVWMHKHDDPDMVLGHAILKKKGKNGDMWADCFFNDNEKAQLAKELVQHGDIGSLSIYAGGLKHQGKGNVVHGDIREVSLVIAGANMGATIENVSLAHGDNGEEKDDEAIIYNDDGTIFLSHSDESEEQSMEEKLDEEKVEETTNDQEELEHADEGKSPKEVWDNMTEEQHNLCYYLIENAVKKAGEKDEGEDEAEHADDDGEVLTMKKNVFDQEAAHEEVLTHAAQKKIIDRARRLGSMKDAWTEALENDDTLKHAVYNDDGTEQQYGIANIDYLFPDYKNLDDRPDFIRRPDDWVNVVMNGVRKTPFARIRTVHANITMEEARALGYVKGNEKKNEVFNLLRRTVDPQTVYKKQKFDKDDIDDITDFDVLAWVKVEMRDMLNEEVARAAIIGDGRDALSEDKIQEAHIKPIWTDDDLYAIKVNVPAGTDDAATAKNMLKQMIRNRYKYRGSGNLIFFTSEVWVAEMLLLEDQIGHPLYETVDALARKLRVSKIVTIPQMENLTRNGKRLMGIAVDLKDYTFGSNKRGQTDFFDDFDIDFNQYKYLIETRLSGMLTKPFSAMVFEIASAGPQYYAVAPADGANPKALGYYEKDGSVWRKTADTTADDDKTYYVRGVMTEVASPTGNPKTQGFYEEDDGVYSLTTDTTVDSSATYYSLGSY